jgi:hypothetical protein
VSEGREKFEICHRNGWQLLKIEGLKNFVFLNIQFLNSTDES